ncbi:uncharacterized protein BYT42DRAFT_577378 [Radiomyces spectabilis]|uniref:uncharacterized protein n=1 Tax=Radiomyces spectabilis TaxID=64574 RepID=UPI00221FEC83|nr:uncharacterized protein BYT42DRAFT_577378 [Radiomyces spectabilis]KAI8374715.1 hypothetical protein BYT42DRAFT_577378 [Radiomyces spectabilis]
MNSLLRSTRSLVKAQRLLHTSASAHERKQFLVVVHDYTDAQGLDRRMAARDLHLQQAKEAQADGSLVLGGALFNSHEQGKMIGSALVYEAESEEEVRQIIAKDPYVKGKVWEKWDIYPFRMAITPSKS